MRKILASVRKKFPTADVRLIEQAFVYTYVSQHKIDYKISHEIESFLNKRFSEYALIYVYIDDRVILKEIDDLVTVFEILVNDVEKKNNGVVYTPVEIRNYITHDIIGEEYIPKIIDPACGCGAFLISAAKRIHDKYTISYKSIYENYIWGCDIDTHSIEKAKLLFNIISLEEGNEPIEKYNLLVGNSLSILACDEYFHKYDVVVGNPPYVRAKNIDEKIKESLSKWSVVVGNVDLYIPFYQLGVELLNNNGKLGYISPNTYLQSVNGRGLRNYVRDKKFNVSIINFKDSQKFQDVTHYTCITIIDTANLNGRISYSIYDGDLYNCNYTSYNILQYSDGAEWRFGNSEIDKLIYKIEHQPQKLNNYNIKNGLATLCNDLFFFHVMKEDDLYYFREYNGKIYRIEKKICIDVAKPNIMRNEQDLISKGEKAIFPYKEGIIINENTMQLLYPYAYNFLLEYKDKLCSRDKGKINNYPTWYAYGRTQGMNNIGKKILIPYMADHGVAIIAENPQLLFYCGYAAFSEDLTTLKLLKIFIESDMFWFYIKMTSKPYSKGFMALAKNYIKNFGLPQLTEMEKDKLFCSNGSDRERFIANLYDINYEMICQHII